MPSAVGVSPASTAVTGASPQVILLVGRRRQAIAAARALGLRILCVDESTPGPKNALLLDDFFLHRFDATAAAWDGLAKRLANRDIAAVFPLSERAVLPAAEIRERLGLPGDGVRTARRCTDKQVMKRAIGQAGLPCTAFVDAAAELTPRQLIERLGLPMVFKSRHGSGGRQNKVLYSADDVHRLPPGWMAERYVEGVEMSIESLVQDGRVLFSNPTEYFRVRWSNLLPARLPAAVLAAVEKLNTAAIAALGIGTAFTHLELFLTPAGPVFSEMAARPPGGHITDLISLAYGFDPWRAWFELGLGATPSLPRTVVQTAGVWVLHPGQGTVARIDGVEEARAVPGVTDLQVRLVPGQKVPVRVGAGQEIGRICVVGRDRDEVAKRLEAAHASLRITLETESSVAVDQRRRQA